MTWVVRSTPRFSDSFSLCARGNSIRGKCPTSDPGAETAHDPRLIIAFYPTRGLDVNSAAAAREILVSFRNSGSGVLLISEDLDELFTLSDRLVVLFRGRIAGVCTPEETSMRKVGYLMTGSKGAGTS